MKTLISHPTGNEFVRAAAVGFHEAGILNEFHTSIATFQGDFLDKLSAFGPFSELRRRRFDSVLMPATKTWPWRETGRMVSAKVGFASLTRHEKGPFCVDAVYKSLDKRVALKLQRNSKNIQAVYAYEDGALYAFRSAKQAGIKCLYDLPIGYWRSARRLLEAERERWPDWAATLTGFNDSEAKLARKDEELGLSDRIFVASRFTATTLQDYPGQLAPVEVIPYAFPKVEEGRQYPEFSGSRPLKILFVGGLSQRKGIADLFAAVQTFGHRIELTVVGRKASNDPCPALDEALKKHTWIPSMPHHEILKTMRQHDVLVFPSLFEGFGLVITEAMSQGTPVITTDRTAGPDLITHGDNGWLVDAGSTEALQASIEEILQSPQIIASAGKSAMEAARKRPWSVYGQELAGAVKRSFLQS